MSQPSPASLWTGRVLTGLFALFMWGGLWLRDVRVRAVLALLK